MHQLLRLMAITLLCTGFSSKGCGDEQKHEAADGLASAAAAFWLKKGSCPASMQELSGWYGGDLKGEWTFTCSDVSVVAVPPHDSPSDVVGLWRRK